MGIGPVQNLFARRRPARGARTLAGLAALLLASCPGLLGEGVPSEGPRKADRPSPASFADVAPRLGVDHRHHTARFDPKVERIMPWLTAGGAGVAVGDFNADGFDDLYVVDSRRGEESALYRNEGGWEFTDIASRSGVARVSEGNNSAVGALWLDYDNDGALDLYVMRFGTSLLFRGDGKGGFRDVTRRSGLGEKRQNLVTGIAFDYDNDGDLDLLVAGYFADHVDLYNLKTTRILHDSFETARNGGTVTLYRNDAGVFSDATAQAGLADTGWSLALGHGDYDNDGFQDVYVANDFGPDKLFRNRGDGTFADVSERAIGVDTKKGMCSEFGDYNNDGFLDIYVTNITSEVLRECNMLWMNGGDGAFTDVSVETQTCDSGWGWGAKFFDMDNDGLLDIYAAAGFVSGESREEYWLDLADLATDPDLDVADAMSWPPIGPKSLAGYQPNRLFHNQPHGIFMEVAEAAGVADTRDSRGVAAADFDNDGSLDLYVTNCNQKAALYRNQGESGHHWLQLKLKGRRSNSNAIGARVRLVAGGRSQIREVNGGNGFSSQSSFRLHFGLGFAEKVDELEIRWPSGLVQKVDPPQVDSILDIEEPPQAAPPSER